MKTVLITSFLFLLLASTTCQKSDEHYVYTVVNNSDYPIWVQESFAYPDTLYNCDLIPFFIRPHESYPITERGTSYEELLEHNKNRYLQLLVVDTATINKLLSIEGYCEQINSKHKVIKRYQLSLQDLENMNWKITYP